MQLLNEAISAAEFLLCILSILLVLALRKVERRNRHYYLWYFICLLLSVGGNLAGQILAEAGDPQLRFAVVIANYCEFLFIGVLPFIGARYMLSLTDPEKRLRWLRLGFLLLLIFHLGLVNLSQFTGWLYTVDELGRYHRAPLYALSLAAPCLSLLGCAGLLFWRWGSLSRRERIAFSIYLLVPLAAAVGQAFVYGVYLVLQSTAISILAMWVFLLADQTERYFNKEREAERLKVSLMLSQIQPHFLYNSLGTIQALCRSDPAKAEQAVGDFAHFLRHNIRSIDSDAPILFPQELNHTQNYLALQKLRFGDDLTIVYDLECDAFSLPTLTLQPLVENAVTHGIRQTESGRGTVTIRTRELEDHYEVSVIDDGVGFDPQAVSSGAGSHIALGNIRTRLARVSGGSLRIVSAPGMGTTAMILLPKALPGKQE